MPLTISNQFFWRMRKNANGFIWFSIIAMIFQKLTNSFEENAIFFKGIYNWIYFIHKQIDTHSFVYGSGDGDPKNPEQCLIPGRWISEVKERGVTLRLWTLSRTFGEIVYRFSAIGDPEVSEEVIIESTGHFSGTN